SGGITNAGLISGGANNNGISVNSVTTFTGGIVNSAGGTIGAGRFGIHLSCVMQFGSSNAGGGITNAGLISGGSAGIALKQIGSFFGGITSSGTIASGAGSGIAVNTAATFNGGLTNSGKIAASKVAINLNAISTFGGNISNAGTITAATGIKISGVTINGGT